mgnify:FL=1
MTKVVKVILEAETGKANANLNKVNKSLKKTEKQAKDTSGAMTSAFNALPASIQGAIGQVKNLGTSFKALAVGGGVAAIAGLGSLFVMATRKGAEFAKQMSTLKAVSGATTSEIDALSNSAKELGSSTQFTAVEVGQLQTEFAKMGFSTKQILDSTKATLDLAASMEVGLAEAAMLAGSTVNSFGLEAKDTQRVVDVLAASTSSSALDFSSLTEAFKNVAPAAKATNRSVEETTGLLGILANNGIKGSRAGTGLSKAFVDLNKKGIPLNDALDKIKNSSNGLTTAMDLAGEIGGKALLVLANKRPQIESLTRTLENSAGAAKGMAETRLDNLAGDTTKLSSAWEGFLLSIEDGEGLFSSIARGIVQATTALLNFITPTTKLSESLEKERFALFKTEAELDRLDVKMQDTTLSEEDLEKAQQDRVKVIDELKLKYPKYLEDIDAETTSTEDLKKAIDQVNKSLINKIIIQEKEEEILEQAEDTAARRLKLDEKQQAAQNYALKLKQELSDLNIKIKATSPNEILKELNEIELEQNRLRLEGNGQNKLKIGQIAELIDKQNNLKSRIKAVNDAEENYNNEQSITNKLTEEKDALMKRLNITTEEATNKTDDNTISLDDNLEAVDEVKKKTRDLILLKQQELKERQNTEAITRDEIAARNDEVKAIQAQIRELQRLSLKKLDIERLDTESLPKLEKREAQKVDVRTSSEEQVNRYVRKVNDNYTGYFRNQSEERKQIILQENAARLDITSNVLSSVENLTRAFGERNEENAKKAFNVQKALGIAQVGINTASAIMKVAAETTDPTPVQAFRIGNMIAMGVAGAAQIAAIAMQKFQPSGGTASTTTPSVNTGGGGTSPTQPPSFNVVGQSGFNQVAGALGQQQPVQAFVVSGDVTTAQQLQNNTITQATF